VPEVSIVIPAFNKAQLTRNCLISLQQTIAGYDGEVIVVDNASTDETPQMLQEFPWVRVLRNGTNLGFAAANNQAARIAAGRYLLLLNNDTQALTGWLDAMLGAASQDRVGVVGARLIFADGTLQHAGVVAMPSLFGPSSFTMVHDLYGSRADDERAMRQRDFQAVTGACMLTPRELYLDLGGLDEAYSNGLEDVDYCMRVRERGLRVVYEPKAALLHFESRSGVARWRRTAANNALAAERWNDKVVLDHNALYIERGTISRQETPVRHNRFAWSTSRIPPITVLVHGEGDRAALERMVRDSYAPVERVVFASTTDAIVTAREIMELRGDRYLAIVDSRARLKRGWLDELLRQLERDPRAGSATFAPDLPAGEQVASIAADARCTLLALRKYPQHHRLSEAPSLDESMAVFLVTAWREFGVAVCAAAEDMMQLPPVRESVRPLLVDNPQLAEKILLQRSKRIARPLVSIVTLSWNAPQFTKLAIESIRAHTPQPYEIIIVDNGSRSETTDWLRTLTDCRVIFNEQNRGFAEGNNQGFAAARGDFVVMLNNDVIVTSGWLDGLLDPFDRIPGLGVSAPRSNKVAGDQQLNDCAYNDIEAMHGYANERRARLRGSGYLTDRAIGLCLCIDRRVLNEIGGIDPRFGVGNFEDDDFCMRVRAAGYKIYVCNDVFIHHFGSQSFAANKVDYAATMHENWRKFAQKWGYSGELGSGYQPRIAIAQGFDADKHFVPLPETASPVEPAERSYRLVFAASVEDEGDWNDVATMVRKYARAFSGSDEVLFSIAALGALAAQTLGERVQRIIEKAGLPVDQAPDIEVSDESDAASWIAQLRAPQLRCAGGKAARSDARLVPLSDRSPSGLQRLLNCVEIPA